MAANSRKPERHTTARGSQLDNGEKGAPSRSVQPVEAEPNAPVLKVEEKHDARQRRFGGSKFEDFNAAILRQTVHAQWYGHAPRDPQAEVATTAAAAGGLAAISPTDAMEGMLAAQMVATHAAAMECYRRAMLPDQTAQGREVNLSQANKLTRSYVTLLQALDKHRGRGQQTVRVEHVHVHEGGQAIVGNVGGGPQPLPSPAAALAIGQSAEHPLQAIPTLPAETLAMMTGGRGGESEG